MTRSPLFAPALISLGLLCTLAGTACLANSALSSAIGLALSGKLDGSPEAKTLLRIRRDSPVLADRAYAAYLLSYLENVSVAERIQFVSEALLYPALPDRIGKNQVARLYRLRAEEDFRRGRFREAKGDFVFVLELGDTQHQEFATLKTGWCDLNLQLPATAFEFWVKSLESGPIADKVSESPSLWQGIGQAYAENPDKTPSDLARVRTLLNSPNAKNDWAKWFFEGVQDGIGSIASEQVAAEWLAQLAELPQGQTFLDSLLADKNLSGALACELLELASLAAATTTQLDSNRVGRSATDCLRHLVTEPHPLQGKAQTWLDLVRRVDWKAGARGERLAYWVSGKNAAEACEEGIAWAVDLASSPDPAANPQPETESPSSAAPHSALPLPSFLPFCLAQATTPEFTSLWREHVKRTPAAFAEATRAGESDIHTLFRDLTRDPEKELHWRKEVAHEGPTYRGSFLPSHLTERWAAQKAFSWETDGPLLKQWVESYFDTSLESTALWPAWVSLLGRYAEAALVHKDWAEAKLVLVAHFGPGSRVDSTTRLSLWVRYLAELSRAGTAAQELTEEANSFLTQNAEGLRAEHFDSVRKTLWHARAWQGLETFFDDHAEKLPPAGRDETALLLANARLSGELIAAYSPKNTALLEVHSFVNQIQASGANSTQNLPSWARKSRFADDISFLARLRSEFDVAIGRAGKSKGVTLAQAWVRTLESSSKKLSQRKWSHQGFLSSGQSLLSRYCGQVQESISAGAVAQSGMQLSEAEWTSVVEKLKGRFQECLASAQETAS